ncbi:MAG: trypsin-like peptidase domain-containing protein [Bryobacterales bacterium]|nr:trypsin-like peptidase domain-containing protein [Bryobacterales bacterium]
MIKAHISATALPDKFAVRYRMRDHQEIGSTAILEEQVLSIHLPTASKPDSIQLIKVSPAVETRTSPEPSHPERVRISGTGFVCGDGLVATNYHVIDGGRTWKIFFPSESKSFALRLVVADKANDLALLRLEPDSGALPKPIAVIPSTGAELGAEIFTIGFPLGDLLGRDHKVTTGVISAKSGIEGDPRVLQVSAPIQPGSSGGPVLDGSGRVIGILTSTLNADYLYSKQRHIPQNVNFAVKSEYLLMLLQQQSDSRTYFPALAGKARTDQIAELLGSIGQISIEE